MAAAGLAGRRRAAHSAGGADATQDRNRAAVRGSSGSGGLGGLARPARLPRRLESTGPGDRHDRGAGRAAAAGKPFFASYAAILALMPARNLIEGFRDVPPRVGVDLRVYAFIDQEHRVARAESWDGIAFVIIMML